MQSRDAILWIERFTNHAWRASRHLAPDDTRPAEAADPPARG